MTLFVFGNAAVDTSYEVPHLPQPGETLLAQTETHDLGGKGLNQAIAAARAGARVSFWSAVGNDAPGHEIRERVTAENIDGAGILEHAGGTDRSMIFVGPTGENTIVSTGRMAHSIYAACAQRMLDSLGPGDLLLMQGNLGKNVTGQCIRAASRRGVHTLLNPAPIDFDYLDILSDVGTLILNEIENQTVSGESDAGMGATALVRHGVKTVVTTLGPEGASLTTARGTQRFAAPVVDAVDTTGAGDVFCGVFAAAIARGMSQAQACAWSVRAASVGVTRRGTLRAFPSADEIGLCRGA